MQVLRLGETLGDQGRSDHLTTMSADQAPLRLGGESETGYDRDHQGIAHAEKQGEEKGGEDRRTDLGKHVGPHTRPRAETPMSISLMPMKGAMIPPRP